MGAAAHLVPTPARRQQRRRLAEATTAEHTQQQQQEHQQQQHAEQQQKKKQRQQQQQQQDNSGVTSHSEANVLELAARGVPRSDSSVLRPLPAPARLGHAHRSVLATPVRLAPAVAPGVRYTSIRNCTSITSSRSASPSASVCFRISFITSLSFGPARGCYTSTRNCTSITSSRSACRARYCSLIRVRPNGWAHHRHRRRRGRSAGGRNAGRGREKEVERTGGWAENQEKGGGGGGGEAKRGGGGMQGGGGS